MAGSVLSAIPAAKPHEPGCGVPVRKSRRSKRRALALILVHVLILVHIAQWKITGRTITPVEPSEAGETLELGYVNAGFVMLAVLILATVVLGRFFCGWACHVVAYQDLCAWLLKKIGLRPKPVRSRLLVFVPLFAALWMFVLPTVIRLWRGYDLPSPTLRMTTDSLWERFPGVTVTVLTLLVDGFLLVWLFGAKGFCTYGCPYGALFAVSDRFAKGRIRVTDACEGCGHCTATCTSNVKVHQEVALYKMVVDPGCMRCMDCISVCPKGALYFGFGSLPGKARKAAKAKPRRVYDFTWPEELVMAAVFLAAFLTFNGLYETVPIMLALGLSVLASIAAIAAWRLISRPALTFQHLALKSSGKLTRVGFAAVAILPLWLVFTAQSGFVRYHHRSGEWWFHRVAEHPHPSDERTEATNKALAHLRTVDRWNLIETPGLHNMLGQLLIESGDNAAAEVHLLEAIELNDEIVTARLRLAEVMIVGRRHDEALEVLRAVLELDPVNEIAGRRLGKIVFERPGLLGARLLLVDLLIERGNLDGAENGVRWILDSDAGHPGANERMDRIRSLRE
ncbi:MAG: tetratricopeptide repeat protein [Planctomycetota bacterium]|nr:tetratricopeptide repeat protein [Planctomycetota bacterium]